MIMACEGVVCGDCVLRAEDFHSAWGAFSSAPQWEVSSPPWAQGDFMSSWWDDSCFVVKILFSLKKYED